jgi:hypothetical protein
MKLICQSTPRCESDGGALFVTRINAGDIGTVTNTGAIDAEPFRSLPVFGGIAGSSADYFHPSVAGQARIAEIVWAASSLGDR